ncbi:hypothetical protein MNV49_005698 [Pseudohyphozyma bogoriensis]|nr:hypothetical protein MNV49_005698 [Pseudohyphozyma bogoriensis]
MSHHRRRVVFAPNASTSGATPAPSYSLLALPPALVSLLSDPATASSIEIRGHKTDAAVLVTDSQTYALRGVQNSNSLMVASSGAQGAMGDGTGGKDIMLHATLHETLEVVQGVARTDKVEALLKGSEYVGEDAEEGRSTAKFQTFETLTTFLPASNLAIRTALTSHRVVPLNDYLRPLPPSYLLKILPPLLTSLNPTLLPAEPESVPPPKKKLKAGKDKAVAPPAPVEKVAGVVDAEVEEMLDTLDSVDCGNEVGKGLLRWFGKQKEGKKDGVWEVNVEELVKEVGIVLLASGGYGKQPLDKYLNQWRTLCGSFAPLCGLPLIASSHLTHVGPPPQITYFPISRLSPDPATRFNELFGVKARWEEADMIRFIDDLVGGEKKKRDGLVLKFVRKVKEADGRTTWAARNLWA